MTDWKSILQQKNDHFGELFNSGQPVKNLYAEDARMFPLGVGGKVFTGRDEIQTFWDASRQKGISGVKITTERVTVAGEYLIEEGSHNSVALGHGRYLVIWKQVNGEWLIDADIFNN